MEPKPSDKYFRLVLSLNNKVLALEQRVKVLETFTKVKKLKSPRVKKNRKSESVPTGRSRSSRLKNNSDIQDGDRQTENTAENEDNDSDKQSTPTRRSSLRLRWKPLTQTKSKAQKHPKESDDIRSDDEEFDRGDADALFDHIDEDYDDPLLESDNGLDSSYEDYNSKNGNMKQKRKTRIRKSKRGNLHQKRSKKDTDPEAEAATEIPIENNNLCNLCGQDFKNPSHLKDHQISHQQNPDLFICPQCSKEFKYERNLTRHLHIHAGTRNNVCTTCQREFVRKADLRRHEKTHSGEKHFLCEICSKTFTRPLSLTQHRRIHTGEYPYACSHCPKAYTTKSALDYHLGKHPEHKPKKITDVAAVESGSTISNPELGKII